jgi:hypothetical protein
MREKTSDRESEIARANERESERERETERTSGGYASRAGLFQSCATHSRTARYHRRIVCGCASAQVERMALGSIGIACLVSGDMLPAIETLEVSTRAALARAEASRGATRPLSCARS